MDKKIIFVPVKMDENFDGVVNCKSSESHFVKKVKRYVFTESEIKGIQNEAINFYLKIMEQKGFRMISKQFSK